MRSALLGVLDRSACWEWVTLCCVKILLGRLDQNIQADVLAVDMTRQAV